MIALPSFRPAVMGLGLDPDAAAYISALETALGSAITASKKTALSEFFKAEKTAGRFTSHKRIFLPIWGNAAANAICLISRATGTFVNSPTHGAGFVQGDGSTQRFDWGASPNGLGLVDGSATLWRICIQAHSTTAYNIPVGVSQAMPSAKRFFRFERSSGNSTFGAGTNITGATDGVGIFIGSEIATNSRFFRVRKTAGVTAIGTNTTTQTGGFPTVNLNSLSSRNDSTFASYSNARLGGYGCSLGLSISNADAFTLNLKTLWETCTGLTLP